MCKAVFAFVLTLLVRNGVGLSVRGRSTESWKGEIVCDPVCHAVKYPYMILNPLVNGTKLLFQGQPFGFGGFSPGLLRTAMITDPPNACSKISPPPKSSEASWIALIHRGGCDFSQKAINAERAGAVAVVMFNDNDSGIFDVYCPVDGSRNVAIPLMMISREDGKQVEEIISSSGGEVQVRLSPFDPLSGLCNKVAFFGDFVWQIGIFFALLVVASICFINRFRRLRLYWAGRSNSPSSGIEEPFLSEEDIQGLKTQTYVLVDSSAQTERCSICLDDFGDGEVQSVLPCGHCFHPRCVKQWLTSHSKQCPLCMRDVTVAGGSAIVHAVTPAVPAIADTDAVPAIAEVDAAPDAAGAVLLADNTSATIDL